MVICVDSDPGVAWLMLDKEKSFSLTFVQQRKKNTEYNFINFSLKWEFCGREMSTSGEKSYHIDITESLKWDFCNQKLIQKMG